MGHQQCAHCASPLFSNIEQEFGEWVVRCLVCGVRNIVVPRLDITGWRE